MNVNVSYGLSYLANAFQANHGFGQASNTRAQTSGLDLTNLVSSAEEDETENVKKPTNQQKEYLKDKYTLSDLTFCYDAPGNDETAKSMQYGSSRVKDFMSELYEMRLISEKEYKSYASPGIWAVKPCKADLERLPHLKEGIWKEPSLYGEDSGRGRAGESYINLYDINGMNLIDAFRLLAAEQAQSADLSLGQAAKEAFSSEAKMYSRLASLLEDIFQ